MEKAGQGSDFEKYVLEFIHETDASNTIFYYIHIPYYLNKFLHKMEVVGLVTEVFCILNHIIYLVILLYNVMNDPI